VEQSSSPETNQPALPSTEAPPPPAVALSQNTQRRINLLASENGGHLVAAPGDIWTSTIDGDETSRCCFALKQSAVYAFKDGRSASFDIFTTLIDRTGNNIVSEFELSAGNESPLGSFDVVGKCETQNVMLFDTPYQECKFPTVRAKYFKVTIVSTFGSGTPALSEFRLFGYVN